MGVPPLDNRGREGVAQQDGLEVHLDEAVLVESGHVGGVEGQVLAAKSLSGKNHLSALHAFLILRELSQEKVQESDEFLRAVVDTGQD